ncbi:MAG: SMP-30/gluconolactonase/LRE family protein [candidate division Zixibacteria bacterium]|nr:SMP-30/gluconolactonase/LRE family protein [candidate division Zixibacteria bacterium]
MNKKIKIELICNPQCSLGENPYWNNIDKKLYFTDITECCLWRCDIKTDEAEKFWTGDFKVGGFAFNQTHQIIMFAENKVLKLHENGTLETLFEMQFRHGQIFNDIIVDPMGRIFAGTVSHEGGSDTLFRFEKGKTPKIVVENLHCSNGMAFSMDQKSFFHTDTRTCRIIKYDYDKQTGAINNPRIFYQGNRPMGLPDGMTIDTDDCIWIAFWGGSTVLKFSPTGQIIGHIPLPCKNPTSLIFGGDKLNELYITSASIGRKSPESRVTKKGELFLGGGIYRIKTQTTGRKEWLANL